MAVNIYILVTIVATGRAMQMQYTPKCNKISVGGQWYEKDILWDFGIGKPYNLNVHKSTNTLFFTYSLPETYSDMDFQIGYLNIRTKEYHTVPGIQGGCALAIDQDNDIVYLGGSDGIYQYSMVSKNAEEYKEKGKNIWSLFFKRKLFYMSYPNQKLYIENGEIFSLVKEFESFEVDQFYISKKNVIYFSNRTGIYKFNNGETKAEVLNELITVRQISEDDEAKLYVCTNVGLFIDSNAQEFQKLWDTKSIYGIAFDRDNNMIYSDARSIVKLIHSGSGCGPGQR